MKKIINFLLVIGMFTLASCGTSSKLFYTVEAEASAKVIVTSPAPKQNVPQEGGTITCRPNCGHTGHQQGYPTTDRNVDNGQQWGNQVWNDQQWDTSILRSDNQQWNNQQGSDQQWNTNPNQSGSANGSTDVYYGERTSKSSNAKPHRKP